MRHQVAAAGWLVACLLATSASAQQGTENGEWRSYAGDVWGTKYAPLDQITGDNFGELELAWRWRSADAHLLYETEVGHSLVSAETLFNLHDGYTYAMSMPGQFYRSQNPLGGFEEGPRLFNPSMRHAALLTRDETLYVFWTQDRKSVV